MKKLLFLFVLMLSLVFSSFTFAALKTKQVQRPDVPGFVGYSEDEIVVKFDPAAWKEFDRSLLADGRFGVFSYDAIAEKYLARQILQKFPGARPRVYRGETIDLAGWFKIRFSGNVDVEAAVQDFLSVSGVLKAEKIGIHTVTGTPNDPKFAEQWHLNQANDADIDAPEAWDVQTGNPNIIVAILDTGVRYFHKDLGGSNASYSTPTNVNGNMWINTDEIQNNGIDDDNNGYVDDWIGWDFVDGKSVWSGEDGSTPDNDPRDFNGHGTHCAGNVGAINNNGYATSAPSGGWNNGSQAPAGNGVKVMALRIGWSARQFIWEVGYVSMDFAASAFYYAANNGAKITSCSWGSSNSGGIADAINYFLAGGGMIFKSAGNSGNESTDYMTGRSDIISVAATNSSDVKASFSSYGTWVDISAPGEGILSLYHNHDDPQNDYVASMDGTSMASPLAASVAALIWSHNPTWTASQVQQRLFDTADDIYGISGNSSYIGKLGAGRVNAYAAVYSGGPAAPVAAFIGSPTSGCAPLTVNFTDQSTGEINSWSWNFGDGATSTQQNPSHQYPTAGNYTVTLTVTGPGGSDVETKNNYISVSATPTAQFSGTPVTGNAPLTVNFTDQSTGNPTSWSWNFGDGGTSTAQNPSHQYTAAGTFTVTLTASNACGSDEETKTNYITVNPCAAPVANFTGTPTSGAAPLTVNFNDQSTNSPTSWSWNFGDGGTSTAQSPSHQYTTAGTYTVTLTASNSCGSDEEVKTNYINVTQPQQNVMHVAAITVTKQKQNNRYRGKADVQIVDANGNPVASATVKGQWSGGATDSDQFTTNTNGWGTAYSNWSRSSTVVFTFCVTSVTKSGWTYDSNANVVTCAGSDGSSSSLNKSLAEGALIETDEVLFNLPNPFNPSTRIHFQVEDNQYVKLEVFDIMGRRITTLIQENMPKGQHSVTWNAVDDFGQTVSSGHYFYVLTVNGEQIAKSKMLFLK